MSGRVANRNFSRAFRWQKRFLFIALALVVGVSLTWLDSTLADSTILAIGLIGVAACAAFAILAVCYYVYRGSVVKRGVSYSVFHVVLIFLLLPAGFVSVFAIPHQMNGDILRFRDWDRRHRNGE